MALGNHPLFLESAAKAGSAAKPPKAPEPQQLPISAGVAFTMEPQRQSNWCSHATAVSTSLFYLPTSIWTQWEVANVILGETTCYDSPFACNYPAYLDAALDVTGNFDSKTGVLSGSQIYALLLAGRPIAAEVRWEQGGGHAVAISGYSKFMNTEWVTIEDPWYGRSTPRLVIFHYDYMLAGTWFQSFLTKAAP